MYTSEDMCPRKDAEELAHVLVREGRGYLSKGYCQVGSTIDCQGWQ